MIQAAPLPPCLTPVTAQRDHLVRHSPEETIAITASMTGIHAHGLELSFELLLALIRVVRSLARVVMQGAVTSAEEDEAGPYARG